tara:strand:- start:740 stop:1957 length:1218 start_codon:yes stop_codon:yes gene_type:complete
MGIRAVTDPLALLLAVLETPDPVIALSSWNRLSVSSQSRLDQSGLVAPFLCSEIICPACDLHHRSPVMEVDSPDGNPRYVIACPFEGQVDLRQEDRLTRSVEVVRVAESIANSLDLEGHVKLVAGDRLVFCGHAWHHGQRVEIYLGRGLGRSDGQRIAAAIPQSPLPQLLCVPQVRPLEGSLDAMKPPAVMALDGMALLEPAGLEVFRGVFDSTVRELVLSRTHPEHKFVKDGDVWSICFRGSEPVSIKHTKGMRYIARLLEFPSRPVSAVTLHLGVSGLDPNVLSGSRGEKLDKQALEEYSMLQDDLVEKLRDARVEGDSALVMALEEGVQAIGDERRGAVDMRGQLRKLTDKETARTSVSSTIGRAIASISKEHKELGQHLKASIRKGHDCVYEPDEPILWVL